MGDDRKFQRTTDTSTERVVVERDGYDPDDHSKEVAGAAAGAVGGAVVGSVVPGIGTAVGAVVGGAAGAIAGKADEMNDDDEVVVERTTHTR